MDMNMTNADLISVAAILVALLTLFFIVFKGLLDVKLQAFDAKIDAMGTSLDVKVSAIQEAVAEGKREHEAFQAGLQNLQQQHNDLLLRLIPGTAPKAANPPP